MNQETMTIADNNVTVKKRGAGKLTPWKKGQSGNPAGKPKGVQDHRVKAVNAILEAIKRGDGGLDAFLDDLRINHPLDLFNAWVKLQPRETHTTVESRKLVVNIMQTAAPLAPVPQRDTQPILDVVPSSDTNAT